MYSKTLTKLSYTCWREIDRFVFKWVKGIDKGDLNRNILKKHVRTHINGYKLNKFRLIKEIGIKPHK